MTGPESQFLDPFEAFDRSCYFCGAEVSSAGGEGGQVAVQALLKPRSRGGWDSPENTVLSCWVCADGKGEDTAEEFLAKISTNGTVKPGDHAACLLPEWRHVAGRVLENHPEQKSRGRMYRLDFADWSSSILCFYRVYLNVAVEDLAKIEIPKNAP